MAFSECSFGLHLLPNRLKSRIGVSAPVELKGETLQCVQGNLQAHRKAAAVVRGDDVMRKLFTVMAQRYKDREGGYTRILRTRQRANDAAPMAYIE